ncbi:nicotinamide riboside transporter PnuC [Undibacterium cyanobacteriorum]|uniref:Nicotinamide riboside transporter PnuC n=1 Tax=Undibacterium cyanobacteriorum TaxID=3073561 RepID=A0ABY9RFU2_9BURK|nr:nicotinamide riboside transporter PnuC [Undibacterium sp. 20NA77.5]WMW79001.1 nicotinamide riboside transporter PnuC [Undibacterium sp. 20NA77.5]
MNQTISLLWGWTTSPLELFSFLLSIVTVACNIRQIHWGWLFAILSSALYALVFFDAKLYGDMSLQFVFIVVSVWGWWQWLQGKDQTTQTTNHRQCDQVAYLRPQVLRQSQWIMSLLFLLIASAVCFGFLKMYTDSDVPATDAILTAGSLLGQILIARKFIENWLVWIVVDVAYVGLYVYKNLHLTAILYGIFVVLAVMGYRSWANDLKTPITEKELRV